MYWNDIEGLIKYWGDEGCLILMYMRFMEAISPRIGRLMDLHHSLFTFV
jgi:hypothetical protein